MKVFSLSDVIPIGYAGENEAREIAIDICQLVRTWPDLRPELVARRPGESEVYPCRTRVEDGVLIWTVTGADTARSGEGEARVYMLDGEGKIAKSRIVKTLIRGGMEGEMREEMPDAAAPWVDNVLDAGSKTEAAAQRAENAARNAEGAAAAALNSEQNAANSEQNAANSEQNAANSAAEAENYKSTALRGAEDAQTSADSAAGSAEAAASSSTAAQESKDAAAESAAKAEAAAKEAKDVQASIPADYTQVVNDVSALKDHIADVLDGKQMLTEEWEYGTLSADGSVAVNPYRVVTEDFLTYDRDIRLEVDPDYYGIVCRYDTNGNLTNRLTGVISGHIIRAGTIFKCSVMRRTEGVKPESLYDFASRITIATKIEHRLDLFEAELDGLFAPTSENIVTLTTATEVFEKEITTDGKSAYVIDVSVMQGRNLRAYAYDGATYKPIRMVNVNSGAAYTTVYQMGKYLLLDTEGAEKIKVSSVTGYSNYMVLNLIRYDAVPYIPGYTRNTKYLEIPEYVKTLPFSRVAGVLDGYAYGYDGRIIYKHNLADGTTETFYDFGKTVSACMLFDNENMMVMSDVDNKMYLLKNGNLTEKHVFYNEAYAMSLLPNRTFSLHAHKNIGIACEYNSAKEPVSGYKAYITKDYGETWDVLFDLEAVVDDPATRNYHLHTAVYDPYQDMYWAACGESTQTQMVYYSIDGETWHKCLNRIAIKPTEIVPMRDCVFFVSDSNQTGVFKWIRKEITAGDTLHFDDVKMFVHQWSGACPIGCIAYHDEVHDLVFFGYQTDSNINAGYSGDELKHGDMFVSDGHNVRQVYKTSGETSCTGVYGDDHYIVCANNGGAIVLTRR